MYICTLYIYIFPDIYIYIYIFVRIQIGIQLDMYVHYISTKTMTHTYHMQTSVVEFVFSIVIDISKLKQIKSMKSFFYVALSKVFLMEALR